MDDRRRARFPAAVQALAVMLQLANLVTAATCAADGAGSGGPVSSSAMNHNNVMIEGLKLDRLPDMTKVDIGNDEFHCKYLEYFRRLYDDADESDDERGDGADLSTATYDDDDAITAMQVRGRMAKSSSRDPTADNGGDIRILETTITFPIERAMLRGDQVSIIKSVVRIFGGTVAENARGPVKVTVLGGLWFGDVMLDKTSRVAELAWPTAGGGGRWQDVDVTRVLRPRKRLMRNVGVGEPITLKLTLLQSTAVGAMRYGDGAGRPRSVDNEIIVDGGDGSGDGGSGDGDEEKEEDDEEEEEEEDDDDDEDERHPVLHFFLDGTLDYQRDRMPDVPCAGVTTRKKRDVRSGGGGGTGSKRRRRPSPTASVRRTDCKAETAADAAGQNGTEHAGGGSNKCCREQMHVVFADIPGFDFIVEPKWFDAGLCRGRCPAKYNPATRHAFIQSLLWKQHNSNNNNNNNNNNNHRGGATDERNRRKVRHHGSPQPPPKPCCAPSKLDRLQILHVDESNPNSLKVTTWKEMSVVECACS